MKLESSRGFVNCLSRTGMTLPGGSKWNIVVGIYARILTGLEDRLICSFKLAVDIVRSDVQECMNDELIFLKRDLV